MAKTTHVRVTPESRDALDVLTGDSILVVAGLGPLTRSEVVTLGCHLVTLLAQDLVANDDTIHCGRPANDDRRCAKQDTGLGLQSLDRARAIAIRRHAPRPRAAGRRDPHHPRVVP